MFSIFKKKVIVSHVRLTGIIGSAGKFKQGIDLDGQASGGVADAAGLSVSARFYTVFGL